MRAAAGRSQADGKESASAHQAVERRVDRNPGATESGDFGDSGRGAAAVAWQSGAGVAPNSGPPGQAGRSQAASAKFGTGRWQNREDS